MKRIDLGTAAGNAVLLDVDRLIESRMLVQANSGSGKSWLIRRLLEQTHGYVQHLVLDHEGEFHTLREKFGYILVARSGGDVAADPRSAGLLARRLLELGTSAIIDLSELQPHERVRFVKLFLEALVNAPRDLWHPVLVVVDEADKFCPEKQEAESRTAVVNLMALGRKRGLCGILATQRISKLGKDAAAEANVKLIGRAALDVDMKRAADELGLTSAEDRLRLRRLEPGRFFAFGPGLSAEVVELQVGGVQTSHPKIGHRAAPIPPPPAQIRKVLEQLADLPKEAEAEQKNLAELKAENSSLKRQLAARPKVEATKPLPPVTQEVLVISEQHVQRMEKALERVRADVAVLDGFGKDLLQGLRRFDPVRGKQAPPVPVRPVSTHDPMRDIHLPAHKVAVAPAPVDGALTGPEQRILDAIAWLESIGNAEPEETAVAFLAGYTIGGGAFNNPKGRLRGRGLIEYRGDRLVLTDAGRGAARTPDSALTTDELHRRVIERLPGPESKLLRVLLDSYPEALANEQLAERSGYAASGGAFNNPRGRLRSLGLIEYVSGGVRARDILFLNGARA